MKRLFDDKLYGNATYLMVTSIVTSGLGFFFWTIAARFYTVEDVGLASTIITSMMLLATLSSLGFDLGLIRFLPQADKEKSSKMINSCLTLSGIAVIVLSTLFIIGLGFWAPKLFFIRQNILYASFFILFTSVWLLGVLVDAVFTAKRTTQYVFIRNLVISVIKLILLFFVVSLGAFGIFFSWGIAALIAFLIAVSCLLPKVILGCRLQFSANKGIIDHMIHFSFGNYVARFLGNSPLFLLPLMITNMLSPEITAYFYISWMIASLLFMIPVAISTSLLAEVSTDEKKFRENLRKGIVFTYLLVIPGILLISLLGDRLLSLFGELYTYNALTSLKIFGFSAVFYSIHLIYEAASNIQKRVGIVVILNGITAFITLGGAYFLLEGYGLVGVALAWTLSQVAVVLFILCRHLGDIKRIVSSILSRYLIF